VRYYFQGKRIIITPRGKQMISQANLTKFTVKLFYFIAVAYTVINLGGPFYGIPSALFLALFTVTVSILFFKTFSISLGKKTIFALVCFMPLILLNSLMSIEVFNSVVYWFLWLMFIIGLLKVIRNIDQEHLEFILKHIPYILLLASVTLYVLLFPYMKYSLPTKNSLGLFAGGTLIAAMSIKESKYKWPSVLISLIILIESDSRSSLVYSVGITLMYIMASLRKKKLPIFMFGAIIFFISFGFLYDWFEQRMLEKEPYATNLQEAVTAAQNERTDLLEMGWELFKERPLIGFGLKSKYYEGRIAVGNGPGIHVHNGYLSTLIETGILISAFVLLYVLSMFRKIIRALLFMPKRLDKVWIFFLLFGLARAYGENYLVFNIGNIFSILFLFLGVTLLFSKKTSLLLKARPLQFSP